MGPDARTDPDVAPIPPEPAARWSRLRWRSVAGLSLLAAVAAWLLPAVRSAPGTALRIHCSRNFRQIGLPLHAYANRYGGLPPAATVDANGRVLHSWRTLILPDLGEADLYASIDLGKPWDDPANARAREHPLRIYHCPNSPAPGNTTTYLAQCGPDACFAPHRPRPLAEIADGQSATLMVVEAGAADAIPWMQPADADAAFLARFAREKSIHATEANALLADGSVRLLKLGTPEPTLRAMRTIAGGEAPPPDAYGRPTIGSPEDRDGPRRPNRP